MDTGQHSRKWEGVECREVIDDDPAIDGYWVSEDGRVWSCWKMGRGAAITDTFQRELKQWTSKGDGNVYVSMRGRTRACSRIIAKAFGVLSDDRDYVVHINGDQTDNRLANLKPIPPEDCGQFGREIAKQRAVTSSRCHGYQTRGYSPAADIVAKLREGVPKLQISRELKCGVTTVRRAARWLKQKDADIK